MRVGIIGSGHIGETLGRLLTAAGHEVGLSHASGPESLRDVVARLGPEACAMTVEEAANFGDVVVLALPWRSREDLPAERLAGKVVVDATNPFAPDGSVYDLGDSTSSEEVAKVLPGARLVKAFNTLRAKDLGSRGAPDQQPDQRIAIFLAGDDDDAKLLVASLVRDVGFAPVDTGELREGGRLQQPGSPLYLRTLAARDAEILLQRTAEGERLGPQGGEPTRPGG